MALLSRDGHDEQTAGSPDAAQDLYGLGVRISFYAQAVGMTLYNHSRRNRNVPAKELKLTSGSISIAVLSCWKVVALETRKLSCKCPAVGCMAAQLSVRQREG
jgi:hypothetical protein